MACFLILGLGYAAVIGVASNNRAQGNEVRDGQLDDGRRLYQTSCITCHGQRLQGVPGRGPSLVGVGQAAVYFQVSKQ